MRLGARAISVSLVGVLAGCGHAHEDGGVPVVPAAVAAPAQAARSDVAVCEASYKYESDFAEYWVARTPGAKRREELPGSEDFVAACKGMPERVQRCLHEHYREVHDKECDLVWSRLDASEQRKVDGLFLEAPIGAGPGAAVPAVVSADAGK